MVASGKKPGRRWPAGANVSVASNYLTHLDGRNADSILASLRNAILSGAVPAGAWLRQDDLATSLGVSRTPIREALRSLERESLVEIIPNHGARVAPLSVEDFEEIYALRTGIESLAAQIAARSASEVEIDEVAAQFRVLDAVKEHASVSEYLKAEWHLRLQCYRTTRRERMLATILHLRGLAERYLRLAYREAADVATSFEFHRRLIDAIRVRDGDTAATVNRQALEWTLIQARPLIQERFGNGETGSGR